MLGYINKAVKNNTLLYNTPVHRYTEHATKDAIKNMARAMNPLYEYHLPNLSKHL